MQAVFPALHVVTPGLLKLKLLMIFSLFCVLPDEAMQHCFQGPGQLPSNHTSTLETWITLPHYAIQKQEAQASHSKSGSGAAQSVWM